MRSVSSCGWRRHILHGQGCWCDPEVDARVCEGCGEVHTVTTHKDVTLSIDRRPRMTVFSR